MLSLLLVLKFIGTFSRANDGWDQATYGVGFCALWDDVCGYGLTGGFADLGTCEAAISAADNGQRQCMIYHTMFSASSLGAKDGVDTTGIDLHCTHGAQANPCDTLPYGPVTGTEFGQNSYNIICDDWTDASGGTMTPGYLFDDATSISSYDNEDDTTRFCWWYHMGVAAGLMRNGGANDMWATDTGMHCQHASGGAGDGAANTDGTVCPVYTPATATYGALFCGLYDSSCGYYTNTAAAGWDALNWHDWGNCVQGYEDASFAARACFLYHNSVWLSSVWGTPDNAHCTHAAGEDPCDPASPGAVTSTEFCAQYMGQCGTFTTAGYAFVDSNGAYSDTMCMTAYDGMADEDRECYWYHLSAAIANNDNVANAGSETDTGSHCMHAAGDGTQCNAFVFATPAPTDSASTKGFLLSAIALFLVFFGN